MKVEEFKDAVKKVSELREQVAAQMEQLPKSGAVAAPTEFYKNSRSALLTGIYNVAFCGRVNCGKSTLLNAVIGKAILPTGDRPLSSRIVEIENCKPEEEGFSLLLQDGSVKTYTEIAKLNDFATQQSINVQSVDGIELDSIILIRLRCHMPNLADGIHLVDTPGIGASYKEHGRLSYHYLKNVHAVVYVLSSEAPLNRVDEPFLKEVFETNKNIIFVQSCADLYDIKHVTETAARNIKLLGDLFSIPQEEINYFTLAAECELNPPCDMMRLDRYEDGEYTQHFSSFMDAWRWMMCRTAGLDALEVALLSAKSYIQTNMEQMNQQLAVAEENSEESKQMCLSAAREARLFREQWTGDGTKWHELIQALEKAVKLSKEDIITRLKNLRAEKLGMLTPENAANLSEDFGTRVNEDIQAEWQNVQRACVDRVNAAMTVLTWEIPAIDNNQEIARLLKNGSLVPMKLSEFGLGDLVRLGSILVSICAGNVVGVVVKSVRFLFSLAKREAQNKRAILEARESLEETFDKMIRNITKSLDSKRNPLAIFFKMAVEKSHRSIVQQYDSLVQHASELLCICGCTDEGRTQLIAELQGTDEKPGLLSVWRQQLDLVNNQLSEIEKLQKQ